MFSGGPAPLRQAAERSLGGLPFPLLPGVLPSGGGTFEARASIMDSVACTLYKILEKSQPETCIFCCFLQKTSPEAAVSGDGKIFRSIPAQGGGRVGGRGLAKVEVVAGQDGVENNAGDGGDGQRGQGDGGAANMEGQASAEA